MPRLTRRRALQATGVGAAGAMGAEAVGADRIGDVAVQSQPGSPFGGLVATWTASHHGPAPDGRSQTGFEDHTLRQVLHTSVGGDSFRLRLSNQFGEKTLIVERAAMALREEGKRIATGTVTPVRFSGNPSVSVPQGARVYSDPVPLEVGPDQDVVVDLYLPFATGGTSWHNFGKDEAFLTDGDMVGNGGTAFTGGPGESYFYVDGLDVVSPDSQGTIVCLGDSITDGARSTEEANNTYPAYLSRRIQDNDALQKSVVNAGMNGNRLLHNSPPNMVFGPAGVTRLDRDVLAQTGVTDVIVLLGVNDILHHEYGFYPNEPITAKRLIDGLEQVVERAHAAGLRIFGGTITPMGSIMDDEAVLDKRRGVNDWIRSSGAFDGVVDFATALSDGGDPAQLAAEYDSGDGLHPNDAGYQRMAQAVPLGALSPPAEPTQPTTSTPTTTARSTTTPPPTEPAGDRPTTGFTMDFGPIEFSVSW